MNDILARLTSWRSTLLGVFLVVNSAGTVLTAVAAAGAAMIDGNPATVPDWGAVTMAAGAVSLGIQQIWHKSPTNPIDNRAAK